MDSTPADIAPHTLYLSVDQIPQPRDCGAIQLAVESDRVMNRGISLEVSATWKLLGWMERKLPKIKVSGFERVNFENVGDPLRRRIQILLTT